MDPTLAGIVSGISGVVVYAAGKLIDHWLGRSKAKTDERNTERNAAFNELKDVWGRNDKLEESIDKCKALLIDEQSKNKDLELRIMRVTQQLTAARAALEHYRRNPIVTNLPTTDELLPPDSSE